ncbi:hypothetical protein DL89DRAFT_117021 [Linderina pennispora]|uniref:Uncharacterized protein n=1 Tax=Linderina pennispora TaxID=61395 RepID=A0A1Y1VVM2_9FUNG|nr:uncharacterized protein DL89DRAFT_117021 [Linderina pennispora]ORX65347.1 hypothetical protein DL89DRAFT_117021 [Linderina pennispora]
MADSYLPSISLSVEEWTSLASAAISLAVVVAACIRLPQLATLPCIDRSYYPCPWTTRTKFVSLFLATSISIFFVLQLAVSVEWRLLAIIPAAAQVLAAAAALRLHVLQHRHSVYTSDILITFWPANWVVAAMSVRNSYRSGKLPGDWPTKWPQAVYLVAVATVFYLELQVTPSERYFRLECDGERYNPKRMRTYIRD